MINYLPVLLLLIPLAMALSLFWDMRPNKKKTGQDLLDYPYGVISDTRLEEYIKSRIESATYDLRQQVRDLGLELGYIRTPEREKWTKIPISKKGNE